MLPQPIVSSGISVVVPTPVFPTSSPPALSPAPDPAPDTVSSQPSFSGATLPQIDPFRIQQLYTLAFADRMRLLHPLTPYPPYSSHIPTILQPGLTSLSGLMPRFGPPPDMAMFPYAKFDPRLFRVPFPDEPKPQHSYIGLISMAILSSTDKKLVLADIYQYILDNFPYFRHRGPGWRNSIRHNLSLNDCFIKAGRAANGKGHYWAVHPACVEDFQKGDFRRRRAQRKVRRHMGLHLEEEDSPSPPDSPASFLPTEDFLVESEKNWNYHKDVVVNTANKRINFDIEFLLRKDYKIKIK